MHVLAFLSQCKSSQGVMYIIVPATVRLILRPNSVYPSSFCPGLDKVLCKVVIHWLLMLGHSSEARASGKFAACNFSVGPTLVPSTS